MEPENEKLLIGLPLDELPPIVFTHLNKNQKQYLQFERRKFKVIGTPQIKTYHIGSLGKGSTAGGGLGTALGDSWGIFANLSSTNMATLNSFRTDIQLRLEDEETHEKIFFEKSFPVEMTLSIEPGDTFSIFSVKAEMKHLIWRDDKDFLSFSPFIAQVDETKQLLPLGKVPEVADSPTEHIAISESPWFKWVMGIFVVAILLLIIVGASSENSTPPENTNTTTTVAVSSASTNTTPNPPAEDNATLSQSGSIDNSSLETQSLTPTITGTFSNVTSAIGVYVWQGSIALPSQLTDASLIKQALWNDGTDHGGEVMMRPMGATSGTYSDTVGTSLQEGEYTVGIYTYHTIYDSGGFEGYTTPVLLATGILNITQ